MRIAQLPIHVLARLGSRPLMNFAHWGTDEFALFTRRFRLNDGRAPWPR